MLNKIKLGPKLIGGFLIVSLIAAVVGFIGVLAIKRIAGEDVNLYQKAITVVHFLNMNVAFQKAKLNLKEIVTLNNISEIEKREKAIGDLSNYADQELAGHEKFLTTDESKKIYDDYVNTKKDYLTVGLKIINLAKESKLEDAQQLMNTDEAKIEMQLQTIVDKMVDYNMKTAEGISNDNTKLASNTSVFMSGTLLVGIMFSLILGIFLALSITRPILMITEGANGFAVGDIELKKMDWNKIAKIIARGDELGDIGKAFAKLIEYQKDKVNIAGEIAKGNIDVKVTQASEADKLGIAFKETVSSLNKMMNQINSAVDQTASGSNQVAQASQSLSQGATEQASSLEEITSSITEINSQAKQNAENALQASSLAKKTLENSEMGNKEMKELVISMANITKNAEEIKKVVKIIDDIAFQTNLLALNANVEAARAGKYGKGFAVVAEEVRNLAGRSAVSVKETTAMVEETVKNIMSGNSLVDVTAKQLDEIANSANKVADLVEEIATASKEQTQGLEQINQGLGQIDQVTQGNTANAEESASAAEELAGQAQQLKAIVAQFKLSDEYAANRIEDFSQKKNIHINMNVNKGITANGVSFEKTKIIRNNNAINPKHVIKLDDDDFGKF